MIIFFQNLKNVKLNATWLRHLIWIFKMPKTKDTGRLLRGIWIDSNKAPVEDSGGWTSDARRIRLPRRLFLSLDCCCCCCRCHDDGATGRAKRLWHPDLCIDSGRMTLNNKKRKKRRRKITQSEASAVTLPHGAEFFRCSHLNTSPTMGTLAFAQHLLHTNEWKLAFRANCSSAEHPPLRRIDTWQSGRNKAQTWADGATQIDTCGGGGERAKLYRSTTHRSTRDKRHCRCNQSSKWPQGNLCNYQTPETTEKFVPKFALVPGGSPVTTLNVPKFFWFNSTTGTPSMSWTSIK